MFCTIRRCYVYMYQMAGSISEEINEAFNATLIDINITTTTHIEGINVRTQINLKGEILEHKVEIQKGITVKKKRGGGTEGKN